MQTEVSDSPSPGDLGGDFRQEGPVSGPDSLSVPPITGTDHQDAFSCTGPLRVIQGIMEDALAKLGARPGPWGGVEGRSPAD